MKFLASNVAVLVVLFFIISNSNIICTEKFHNDSIPAAASHDSYTTHSSIEYSSRQHTFHSMLLSRTQHDVLLADAGDEHATDAKQFRKRSSFSFLPPSSSSSNAGGYQSSSGYNAFRELLGRNIDGNNDNLLDTSHFSSYRPHRKQSEIHTGMSVRYTREVHVKQGRLVGIVREMPLQSKLKNVDQFLGIPYAEAPVGSRRFMPPSSPLPWHGIKYANKLESVCPQKLPNLADSSRYNKARYDQIKRMLPFLKNESEDCLYLNLYVTSLGECFYFIFISFFDRFE